MARRAVPPGRLRRRLTIALVLVAGVSTAGLALGSILMVRQAWFDDSLRRAADDVRYQLVLAGQFVPLDDERRRGLLESFEGSGRHVLLVTGDDVRPSDPAFAAVPGTRAREAAADGEIAYERRAGAARDHLLLVGGRIPGSTAELYVVQDEQRIHRDLEQLGTVLLGGWVLVVVVAALVGRVLARRTLEPVGRASDAARAVAEGLLDTRLPVDARDEFGAWAESFNQMAAALEAKIVALSAAQARERRFTADVAHELRTPVTALVAAASLLREHLAELPEDARRPAQLLTADVVRLRHLIDELMEISRLDAGQEDVAVRPVDLDGLVRAIVDSRGWRDRVVVLDDTPRDPSPDPSAGAPPPAPDDLVEDRAEPSAVVRTDPRRLERVVANLVANAVEHGGRGIRVHTLVDGATATVRVTDRGPGIPAEHLPHLFERFYKSDPARGGSGSGLGLAIAWENARLLGGDLRAWSEVGVGTEFRLTLPLGEAVPPPPVRLHRRPVTERLPDSEGTVHRDAHREAQTTSEGESR